MVSRIVLFFMLVAPAAAQLQRVVIIDEVQGAGLGAAQVPWSAGGTYPLCQAVSAGGSDYLAVGSCPGVTPGTNIKCWYPVPNNQPPTQLDCGVYTAASMQDSGVSATVVMGAGIYTSNIGLVFPTVAQAGWPTVNMYGMGRNQTMVTLATNNGDGFPFLYLPKTQVPYAFASFIWQGFTVNAGWNAPGAVGIYGAQQYTLRDMILANAADGSDHEIEFGDINDTQHGWTFEPELDNVDLGTFKGFGGGAVIQTMVANGVPSFNVILGGVGYSAANTKAVLAGHCGNPGVTTPVLDNGVVIGVTSTATNCPTPLYTIIYSGPNVAYGYKFSNTSDSKMISSLTNGGVGWVAGMFISDVSSQMDIWKYHPESVMIGVQVYGGAALYSMQCDTVFQYCAEIGGGSVVDFFAPVFEWNNPNMTASRDFLFDIPKGIPGYSEPQAVNIYGERCGNQAVQPGYAHLESALGIIDNALGKASAPMPSYVHETDMLRCNLFGKH